MRPIWTLLKVIVALAIAIPVAMVLFATTLGVLGFVIGIAFAALKLAILAVIGLAVFRLGVRLFRPKQPPTEPAARVLPPVDPHYTAAMRELEIELGERPR